MNKQQEQRYAFISKVLLDIVSSSDLSSDLIFKGGTSLMIFYGLDRFSEDLDFNFRDSGSINKLEKILEENSYTFTNKKTLFGSRFTVVYKQEDTPFHCIIDLASYRYKTKPEVETKVFGGKNVKVLNLEHNFAHKLYAFYERKKGRDLLDIRFYLSKGVMPDEKILQERHRMNFPESMRRVIKEIQTPYLSQRLEKALTQLQYKSETSSDFQKNLSEVLQKNYMPDFSFNLTFKQELASGKKIVEIDNSRTLIRDFPLAKTSYAIVEKENMDIEYECDSSAKLFTYIYKNILNDNLSTETRPKRRFNIS